MDLLKALFKAAVQGKGFDTRARKFTRDHRRVVMPHQGTREACRRRGGSEWQQHLAKDRAARGL